MTNPALLYLEPFRPGAAEEVRRGASGGIVGVENQLGRLDHLSQQIDALNRDLSKQAVPPVAQPPQNDAALDDDLTRKMKELDARLEAIKREMAAIAPPVLPVVELDPKSQRALEEAKKCLQDFNARLERVKPKPAAEGPSSERSAAPVSKGASASKAADPVYSEGPSPRPSLSRTARNDQHFLATAEQQQSVKRQFDFGQGPGVGSGVAARDSSAEPSRRPLLSRTPRNDQGFLATAQKQSDERFLDFGQGPSVGPGVVMPSEKKSLDGAKELSSCTKLLGVVGVVALIVGVLLLTLSLALSLALPFLIAAGVLITGGVASGGFAAFQWMKA